MKATRYDEDDIWTLYEASLKQAKANLAKIKVFCGMAPGFAGLSGWVFEQTIQYCIRKELKARGIERIIAEQVSLGGRSKADLTVGSVAVEIKTSGLFGLGDVRRYRQYREAAESKGLRYVFLTWGENYRPYREGIIKALGRSNVFYLNDSGSWAKFVVVLAKEQNKRSPNKAVVGTSLRAAPHR